MEKQINTEGEINTESEITIDDEINTECEINTEGEINIEDKINMDDEINRKSEFPQVWVCVVPREEAVIRIMERDGRSREEAERRVCSQLSNAGEQKDGQLSVLIFSKL